MDTKRKFASLAAIVVVCACGSSALGSYRVVDLGLLANNGVGSFANAINSRGDAAGAGTFRQNGCTNEHAVIFSGGKLVDVAGNIFGSTPSMATGINVRGDVIGIQNARAFLVSGGAVVDINTLPNIYDSNAAGIDRFGNVVGQVRIWVGNQVATHAYLYHNGTMRDINGLFGGDCSEATAINDNGQIAGIARNGQGRWIAFRVENALGPKSGMATITDLGGLGEGNSMPNAISSNGYVAGVSYYVQNESHAFLNSQGRMQDLGVLPGATGSVALGVNSSGQVVGFSQSAWSSQAFLFDRGVMRDLNTLVTTPGWELVSASAINDSGQIVGTGSFNGAQHAFELIPNKGP